MSKIGNSSFGVRIGSNVVSKIYIGSTLVYSSISSDPYFSNVSLLMHMQGAHASQAFIDSSSYGRTLTPSANAIISTTQSKFNGSSGYFDGNSQVTTPDADELDFGTGNFTVECWAYPTNTSGPANFFATGGGFGGWFYGHGEGGVYGVGFGRAAQSWDLSQIGTLTLNAWQHVAVTRQGTTLRGFVDGALVVSETISSSLSYNMSDNLYIGSHGGFLYYNGYMAELRITKGIARYVAAFTPPNAAFPDQ